MQPALGHPICLRYPPNPYITTVPLCLLLGFWLPFISVHWRESRDEESEPSSPSKEFSSPQQAALSFSPQRRERILDRWQQLATFPAGFPIDFQGKLAEKIAKDNRRIVDTWQVVVVYANRLPNTQVTITWPWVEGVATLYDSLLLQATKYPFLRPL